MSESNSVEIGSVVEPEVVDPKASDAAKQAFALMAPTDKPDPDVASAGVPAVSEERPPALAEGETRFGVTATGGPLGKAHWMADSTVCGDLVMALPSTVLIAGRTAEAGGVAVDMSLFLDAIVEGVASMEALAGVAKSASLPVWAVARLFGTFPVLMSVYHDAMDMHVLTVEASVMKAAAGMRVKNERKLRREKDTPDGHWSEKTEETLEKDILPDPTLAKMVLTSRMKGRYKEAEGSRQAVQINILGAEARL